MDAVGFRLAVVYTCGDLEPGQAVDVPQPDEVPLDRVQRLDGSLDGELRLDELLQLRRVELPERAEYLLLALRSVLQVAEPLLDLAVFFLIVR